MAISILAGVLALFGLLLHFWGFVAVAIAIAVVRGNWAMALILALIADIVYGTPLGILRHLLVPFTLAAAGALVARYFLTKNMRE